MNTVQVLLCPFCGKFPEAQRWHGGGPRKTLIGCENEHCHASPSVTGSTARIAEERWNRRDGLTRGLKMPVAVKPRGT